MEQPFKSMDNLTSTADTDIEFDRLFRKDASNDNAPNQDEIEFPSGLLTLY